MTLEEMMVKILDHSCSNPADYNEWVKNQRNYTGWNLYRIETHCVEWEITAKNVDGKWIIKEAKAKDC